MALILSNWSIKVSLWASHNQTESVFGHAFNGYGDMPSVSYLRRFKP